MTKWISVVYNYLFLLCIHLFVVVNELSNHCSHLHGGTVESAGLIPIAIVVECGFSMSLFTVDTAGFGICSCLSTMWCCLSAACMCWSQWCTRWSGSSVLWSSHQLNLCLISIGSSDCWSRSAIAGSGSCNHCSHLSGLLSVVCSC